MSRTLASATPGADIVVKAGADGKIAQGFLPDTSRALFSGLMSAVPTQALTGFNTWVNQGNAVVADTGAGLTLSNFGTGSGLNGLIKTAPSIPYTIACLFAGSNFTTGSDNNYGGYGFGWHDASTGKFQTLHNQVNAYLSMWQLQINNWSSYSSVASSPVQTRAAGAAGLIWLRLKDDGSTIYFQACMDNYSWITLYSVAKTSGYLKTSGYNQIVYYVSKSTVNSAVTMMSYAEV